MLDLACVLVIPNKQKPFALFTESTEIELL
jgi:hypothetical protein